jgi:hypothetical protein
VNSWKWLSPFDKSANRKKVASAKKDPTKHVNGATKTMAAAEAYELQAAKRRQG